MKTILGAALEPQHFDWQLEGGVATITLNRPDRVNPLTFDSYGALRDTFREVRRHHRRGRGQWRLI